MIPESKFAGLRIRNLLFGILWILGMTVFFYLRYTFGFERLIVNAFLILAFLVLFLLFAVNRRVEGKLAGNRSEPFTGLMRMTLISVVVLCGYTFLPHYTAPFLLLAFFLAAVSQTELAMIVAMFLAVFWTINSGGSVYELSQYVMLSLAGVVFVPLYRTEKNRPALSFIVFCMQVVLPSVFSYLPAGQINLRVVVYGAATGLLTDLLFILLFDKMKRVVAEAPTRSLHEIVSENYPLVREIRSFSPADYAHALEVSKLSAKCAAVAGLNAEIAAAGGFYYRLGILGGEPVVENGVTLAQLNCFPQEVITILSEYNGKEREISTPESAVVNLVNHLVSRFEHLKDATKKSDWNREIVIYQTLNELSGSGLYDRSGLSINGYLKIREYLVRGDDLR